MEMVFDWRSIGSLLATLVFIRTAVREFLPPELQDFLRSLFGRLTKALRPTVSILIEEADAGGGANELYEAAQLYLGSRCLGASPTIRLHKDRQSPLPVASLPDSNTTHDSFHAISLRWTSRTFDRSNSNPSHDPFGRPSSGSSDHRSLELRFHRRHRDAVHNLYIPYILDEASKIRQKVRERKLYTNRAAFHGDDHHHRMWTSHTFNHPSTFETLAIDPTVHEELRADLIRFTSRRDHYARVGRAWKRGYLLHGPPGTGKTSLVAAIANLLEFDVYDLELTTVPTNSHLRRLLASTTPKSVVVIEDVDCSLDLSDRKKKAKEENIVDAAQSKLAALARETVSLSGILNFVDGLWSSCVGERLIVLTTNHPERLDPALLRPGRMDRKIVLGFCGPAALRVLARNYLSVGEEGHALMPTAELLLGEARMTPAEVAEVFMGCDGDGADAAMSRLVEELSARKEARPSSMGEPNGAATVLDSKDID